jgi:hypothetical protein
MSEDEKVKRKSKEDRIEEKEKQEAELERSLAVAKVKASHKQIEEIERLRKRPIARSICSRIRSFLLIIQPTMNALSEPDFRNLPLTGDGASATDNIEETYNSIRHDFQKNLDIGEEGMAKMFPVIKFRRDSLRHVSNDLAAIATQLSQMYSYCERLLE